MATAPPYPANTRAKGWRFELDYEQIEQSDTWDLAGPEGRPWLLMMWLTAWRQLPCGSLPADEEVTAAKLGMPAKLWAKHRAVLMRGWWPADDGRLYHPTLTKRVEEMMTRRRSDSDRKARERARKQAESDADTQGITPESRVTPPGLPPESSTDNRLPTEEEVSDVLRTSSSAGPTDRQRPTIPCPYSAIVGAYHEALPGLPRVRLMTAKRQQAMRKLWGWVLSSRKSDGSPRATTGDEALGWLRAYFERAAENDFLMGRGHRSAEHSGWTADLEFLLSEKGMKHVIERTEVAA